MHTQNAQDWSLVNRRLVAKAIAEMSFEQVVHPSASPEGYELSLQSGARYRFQGWTTIWGFLRIDAETLQRQVDDAAAWSPVDNAGHYFLDVQSETGMDDIILSNFLEEMHRTLFADLKLLKLQRTQTAEQLVEMDGDTLQAYLDGHPKALLNKGRIGWSASDIELYAPESMPAFPLFWIAVEKDQLQKAQLPFWTSERILGESLQADEYARFQCALAAADLNEARYDFVPVHPWQWEEVIQQQFAGAIAQGQIVPLGFFGDRYRPQTSLRTMSNVDRPERLQIKLCVSILNTSSVRGLPAHYVSIAPELALWLAQVCERDTLLQKSGTHVLQDVASVHLAQDIYAKVPAAPYRYHEYLGAVWRESSQARLNENEQAVLTASLFQKDAAGDALITHWIARSGLSIAAWLQAYFEVVVVPLFHLQCKYGIGVVAHGQNIVLRLNQGRPVGLYLKDLQGDLRLVDEELPELESLNPTIKSKLTRLPAHYLIHDLQTGHLITVLRFLSATLHEATGFSEQEFYQILSRALQSYQNNQPELAERIQKRSLIGPRMVRVLINKVRFKIGYADSAERPLPTLGTDLTNPLHPYTPGGNDVSASV